MPSRVQLQVHLRSSRISPQPAAPGSGLRAGAEVSHDQWMVIDTARVAIVGAGSVGASMAYAMLIRRSARTIALYDVSAAKVAAEVLDLSHGSQFTGSSEVVGGDDPAVVEGAHVVVITAGAKQQSGQTRLDLAATNVALLEKLLPVLLER